MAPINLANGHPSSGSPETSAESSTHSQHSIMDDDDDSVSTGSGSRKSQSTDVQSELAKRQQHIAYSRCAALVLVLLAAAGAGAATYFLTSKSQEEDIQKQVDAVAQEVLFTTEDNLGIIAQVMETMSLSLTALAASQDAHQWPFYTQPDFAGLFGKSFLGNTGATLISWSPTVMGDFERVAWSNYSTTMSSAWLPQSMADDVPSQIYATSNSGQPILEQGSGPFAPVWQMVVGAEDTLDSMAVNYNLLNDHIFAESYERVLATHQQVVSPIVDASTLYGSSTEISSKGSGPTSLLMTPIFANSHEGYHDDEDHEDEEEEDEGPVATLTAVLPWDLFFSYILHPDQPSVYVVVEQDEACSGTTFSNGQETVFSYQIVGDEAIYLGEGEVYPEQYMEQGVSTTFGQDYMGGSCFYTITMYPSDELYHIATKNDSTAAIWTAIVVLVILLAGAIFFGYDYAVQRRQMKTMDAAAKTNAIVSSLFPAEIRDRLLGKQSKNSNKTAGASPVPNASMPESTKYRLKNYLAEEDGAMGGGNGAGASGPDFENDEKVREAMAGIDMHETKPIAELFPNTTVMFADIAGFTAWSSVREPSQVFVLLETVYRAFDNIAKRRKVFKVETVGDCYVAVTGLPEPRKDHAVVMCKFAKECLEKFNELSKQLEITLGPDTGDLAMRAGLHSGPVTAGVLRGDKSRFQLFGDTVNTAARVEATGLRNRVHLSTDTANLLTEAGKEHWVKKRADVVTAKGKGELHTFWLVTPGQDNGGVGDENNPESAHRDGINLEDLEASLPPKIQRLVAWNVEILKKLLQQIIAKRNAETNKRNYDVQLRRLETDINKRKQLMGEVTEIISLPKFDANSHKNQESPNKVVIPEEVVKELRLYVCSIAALHRDNYFHNFEHASHVTMSVSKLLTRIVAPSDIMDKEEGGNLASALHDHTFGITSDPLTQFATVLSALIHDTDHMGVSNAQLIKEKHSLAEFHKNKSVAEQNSIVLAWEKLMNPSFAHLRHTIYGTPSELERFRQIVVNNVLATDIFDKELQTVRKNRWDKAFSKADGEVTQESAETTINRKATIVMEHLIQASDVSHTMQHWHIYRKWNERLFAEMVTAHKKGRLPFDPKAGWYKGELGFFDNYIIPLAKKLKDCGVFGVSSDEYLNYALENRREWASKGEEVVAQYIEKYCKEENDDEGDESKDKPTSEGK